MHWQFYIENSTLFRMKNCKHCKIFPPNSSEINQTPQSWPRKSFKNVCRCDSLEDSMLFYMKFCKICPPLYKFIFKQKFKYIKSSRAGPLILISLKKYWNFGILDNRFKAYLKKNMGKNSLYCLFMCLWMKMHIVASC